MVRNRLSVAKVRSIVMQHLASRLIELASGLKGQSKVIAKAAGDSSYVLLDMLDSFGDMIRFGVLVRMNRSIVIDLDAHVRRGFAGRLDTTERNRKRSTDKPILSGRFDSVEEMVAALDEAFDREVATPLGCGGE